MTRIYYGNIVEILYIAPVSIWSLFSDLKYVPE